VYDQRLIVIEAVRQLVPETITNLLPQVHESLTCFDVDVRFFGQEVCYHTHVDLWLLLPDLLDGLRSVLVEVGLQSFKELSIL
jgi:hypothetical protein